MLQRLPVDLSVFKKLRTGNYLYVDKTYYAYKMLTQGNYYFLSRPRRFGKSLFVSTLKEILLGNKELFTQLWIAQSDYAWREHEVITLDFSTIGSTASVTSFSQGLCLHLRSIAQEHLIALDTASQEPAQLLHQLVRLLTQKRGNPVAILIDEYDHPLLPTLHDPKRAAAHREILHSFFSTIKGLSEYLDFVFITGITAFSKAGIFSGLNNLQSISLDKHFAGICGYTDKEIDAYLAGYIQAWSDEKQSSYKELRAQLRDWYNGYRFCLPPSSERDASSVYNPFSVLNALHQQEFDNYWFRSGNPSFLISLLKKQYNSIDAAPIQATKDELEASFDIDSLPLKTLLFQTGYLTITANHERIVELDYPNKEVREAFQTYLLQYFTRTGAVTLGKISSDLATSLETDNLEQFRILIEKLCLQIPYQLHKSLEAYYHTIVLLALRLAGILVIAEHSAALGRADLLIETTHTRYIIEIKLNQPAHVAIQQIQQRAYSAAFLDTQKPLTLIGLSFWRKPKLFKVELSSHRLSH